jgi:hypothetical protein
MHTFQDQHLKYGYLNEQQEVIIPCQFDTAKDFQANGLAMVGIASKYGLIDRAGKEVLPLVYDKIAYDHTLKIYLTTQANLSGFANQKGEVVLSCLFDLDYVLAFLQK